MNARPLALAVLLIGVMAGVGIQARGQEGTPSQSVGSDLSSKNRHASRDVEKQLAHLTRKLHLSTGQQEKIRPILEDRATQMEAVRHDKSVSPEARGEKTGQIIDESNGRIGTLLSSAQREAFEKERVTMERHMRRHHSDAFLDDSSPPPDDDGAGPPDMGPPPDGGGPPDGGPPGW